MKLTSICGTALQSATRPSIRETPAKSAGSKERSRGFGGLTRALKNLPTALSQSCQPAAAPPPRRSAQSLQNAKDHRIGDIAAAIEHARKGYAKGKPSPTLAGSTHVSGRVGRQQMPVDQIASTSHSLPPRRLIELMHEQLATDLTTKDKYHAEVQLRIPEPLIPSPAANVSVGSLESTQASTSNRLPESDALMSEAGDVSIRWAADSHPTNLLWQKLGKEQKQEIFDAMSDRGDLAGIELWERASRGDIHAMDRLDNHLLQHYYKDEFGNANHLRFAPTEANRVPRETTPADTRAYMRTMQPLLDAHLEALAKQRVPTTSANGTWLTSLFKRANKKA